MSKLQDLSCNSTIESNGTTGELIKTRVWYHGLEFCFYPSYSFSIKGSIHKYIHGGKHNYSILSYNDAINALKDLCSLLDLSPNKLKIESFEFGVNLHLPFDPSLVIEHITQYKGRVPDIDRNRKKYKVFNYDDRDIKLYDKGLQYHLLHYLLRFEVRIKKMRYLDRLTEDVINLPIRTLSDLIEADLPGIFIQSLADIWSNIYLDESYRITNIHPLKRKERNLLMLARESEYWKEIKGKCSKEGKMKELNGIYRKYLGNSFHDEIKERIIKSK